MNIFYTLFEFSESKSQSNLRKHGIDFNQAQELWNDPNLLEIPAKDIEESRFLVIGRMGSKHWSAIVTYRGDRVRVISVRRARAKEIALYESQ
jgi:uncharacterized DUF497 family protein